ncbi:MAG: serine/threonine-protein kinase, partial [Casimicrobium sp.]
MTNLSNPNADDTFDADRWRRIDRAFDHALELGDSERNRFLASLDTDDATIAAEVRRLVLRTQGAATNAKNPPANRDESSETTVHTFDGLLVDALGPEPVPASPRYRGELCGAWRLESIIGTGGMGEVWLAERADGLYDAKVAVKFLRADTNMAAFEARFAQERALLARLNHPNIARLIDAGRTGREPYLVLEFVEGVTLLKYADQFAPTVEQRLALLRQIAEAIAYAHAQLVVHRDLKPSNVLVNKAGEVKLLDFGVAGLLANDDLGQTTESPATRIAGRGLTLEYAAPEQIVGEASGVGSDIYSLGAIAFHLLTGQR